MCQLLAGYSSRVHRTRSQQTSCPRIEVLLKSVITSTTQGFRLSPDQLKDVFYGKGLGISPNVVDDWLALKEQLLQKSFEILSIRSQYFGDITENCIEEAHEMAFLVKQGSDVAFPVCYENSRDVITAKLKVEADKQLAKIHLEPETNKNEKCGKETLPVENNTDKCVLKTRERDWGLPLLLQTSERAETRRTLLRTSKYLVPHIKYCIQDLPLVSFIDGWVLL